MSRITCILDVYIQNKMELSFHLVMLLILSIEKITLLLVPLMDGYGYTAEFQYFLSLFVLEDIVHWNNALFVDVMRVL